jgi:cyclopropane fatty-acyl-phospholipid synthase-like methyltransferase
MAPADAAWLRSLLMTDTAAPPRLTRLTFHGPLSEARAARIIERLARANPATVLDIGCGWAELMLRILAALPGATGAGIDLDERDLERARDSAGMRGLAERAEFARESATGTTRGPADLVLCLGASQALSDARPPRHTAEALQALRKLVAPGGRVLLGEGFWERPPAPAELAAMWPDASAEEFTDLAGLVDLAVESGFRPEWIETASLEEWDDFESGFQADVQEWLATHDAPEARAGADQHRSRWLRGYRGLLGLAYLTLVPDQAG